MFGSPFAISFRQIRTEEDKNVLSAWDMLFQQRDKLVWDETILIPLSVAILRAKNASKLAELIQLVFEANNLQKQVDTKDVQAVVDALVEADAIGPAWLPVAVSWLVFHRRVDAALQLFAT